MNTNQATTDCSHPERQRGAKPGGTASPRRPLPLEDVGCDETSLPGFGRYALRREGDCWQLTFQGQCSVFKHELGALYIAYLLGHPPREPIHGVALALKAREKFGLAASPEEIVQQRALGLEEAASVRALWRRQRELERILGDRQEIEPVKAEAQRELEEITEALRQSPWLSSHGAERTARAVAAAIKRLHTHLAMAVDAEGKPDAVLRAFALHLHEYLLVPSGRAGAWARAQAVPGSAHCFIYQPPAGVVWRAEGEREFTRAQPLAGQGSRRHLPYQTGPESDPCRPAAVGYLSRFLCACLALALLATGCVGPRPLKGGKAVTTRKPAGNLEQTLMQGENPSEATRQTQETVKLRTYTVPAGSRIEGSPSTFNPQPSTADPPSTGFTLSAPMPVTEREEARARTELGAAQKDTARDLGARLSSLKGIVWVGVGLFVFGVASLVWPPLKAVIGSVTTSAALALGGVALIVLPSLVVGNELLILGGVGVAVGGWFLAHRHGHLRGIVAASAEAPGTAPGSR
jgi:hypothetical protein